MIITCLSVISYDKIPYLITYLYKSKFGSLKNILLQIV